MGFSGVLLATLLVFLLVTIVTYSILGSARPTLLKELSPKTGSMGKMTRVGDTGDGRDRFLTPSGATVMAYIFCAMNSKTPQVGNVQTPINILSVGNVVRLQMLPGGASGKPRTQLVVMTQNPDPKAQKEEVFEVADFPQQRWIHTAIVREGRRFTLYYNGKVVSSKRTIYYPFVDTASIQLGSPRLLGEFMFPKVVPTPLRIEELNAELAETSNTRHEPTPPMDFSSTFSFFSFGCPNGIFCFSTAGAPQTTPLKVWKTPYA